jgi:bifunctional polynucleotide phosphatase/kinase
MSLTWRKYETVIFREPDFTDLIKSKINILGLDMDGTLIRPKSKRKFPKDENDWQWLYPEIPRIIQQYSQISDLQIIIFSNQAGIKDDMQKANIIINKIKQMDRDIGFELPVFMATHKDKYHKPSPLMFGIALRERQISSFTYVGDAAGRKKDFSDSDYKFSLNVGNFYNIQTQFKTPEEFFKSQSSMNDPPNLSGFNPFTYNNPDSPTINLSQTPEIILLMGYPASGKSTLANLFSSCGYIIINRDTIGNMEKCIKIAEIEIKKGNSIIIDNTNVSFEHRKNFILIAQKYFISIRLIKMIASSDIIYHLNMTRMMSTGNIKDKISSIVYKTLTYNEPSFSEGYSEIIEYPFIFNEDILETNVKKYYYLLYSNKD